MESGMQQTTESNEQATQAPAEGARRLNLVQRLRDRAYGSKIPDPLVEEAADEIERLERSVLDLRVANEFIRRKMCRERIVVVDGACVGD